MIGGAIIAAWLICKDDRPLLPEGSGKSNLHDYGAMEHCYVRPADHCFSGKSPTRSSLPNFRAPLATSLDRLS